MCVGSSLRKERSAFYYGVCTATYGTSFFEVFVIIQTEVADSKFLL